MKKILTYFLIVITAALSLAAVVRVANAQTGNGYDLTWWTVDNGGSGGGNVGDGKQVTGGDYTLLSTAGQHDADPVNTNGQVTGGSYSLRSGFWPGENLVPSYVYLPIVLKSPLPDLIGTFTINPSSPNAGEPVVVTAVITNQGSVAASAFWVDFYINPSTTPSVNQRWDSICGISPCNGIAWFVPGGLSPGSSVMLTSNSFDPDQSIWPGYFEAGTTDLYIYVDSWNPGVATGGVVESNEGNNTDYLGGLTVSGLEVSGQSVPAPNLPPRPAP